MVFMSWILTPLEHLLQQIQRLSDSPSPLLNLLTGRNVIAECRSAYEKMLEMPLASGPLKTVDWYYPGHGQEDFVRSVVLSVSAQLWWRWLPYGCWPYKLSGFAPAVGK